MYVYVYTYSGASPKRCFKVQYTAFTRTKRVRRYVRCTVQRTLSELKSFCNQSYSTYTVRKYESTSEVLPEVRKYFRSSFVRCTRVVLHPRNSKKTSKRTYSPSIHVIRKKPAKKRTRDYTCTNTNKSVRASTRARYLRITTLSTFEGR